MAKSFTPKIITANHLLEGDAIYLTPAKSWSENFGEAQVFVDAVTAEQALKDTQRDSQTVVGTYLADVSVHDDGDFSPTHFREEFRTKGPSNYFHGKQAEA